VSRNVNPGKREREARKRHRRAVVTIWPNGAEVVRLKLGRRHMARFIKRGYHPPVADAEKPGESVR